MHRADRQFVLTSIYVICTLIITFAAMFAQADYYYVSMDGDNGNSGTSLGDAWRTISYAMDHVPTDGTATNPHIVRVAAGTYTYTTGGGSDNEDFPINWSDRNLQHVWLIGEDRDTTIVDYDQWPDDHENDEIIGVFEVIGISEYLNDVTISTLTIRNGQSYLDGAGVYVASAHVTVSNCLIEYGNSVEDGGGINVGSDYWGAGHVVVTGCTIQHNDANQGGAIMAKEGSTLDVVNSLIQHNTAVYANGTGGHGGGIYMAGTPDGTCLIRDCDILENDADPDYGSGGGIYLVDSSPHIAHNMIRATAAHRHTGPGNTAYLGAGIYMTGDSDPLIDEWNEIAENWASLSGGGLYANQVSSTPQIQGNEFFWNIASEGNGGGLCSNQANLIVKGNFIHGNEANGSGGGIYCVEGSGSVHSIYDINWISDNQSDTTGGGICFVNGVAASHLRNNNVWANRAADGDGIHLEQSAGLTLQDNGIWDNGTPTSPGEGIRVDGGAATLFNNLVFSSTSNNNQAIGVYVRSVLGSPTLTIRNLTIAGHSVAGLRTHAQSKADIWLYDCILWGNGVSINEMGTSTDIEVNYTDMQEDWYGAGGNNKKQNPLFVPLSGARGWPVGYFLSQTEAGQGENSPCVDTGSVDISATDFTSDYCTRTDAASDTGQVDMGYHYLHEGATYIELDSFEAKGLNGKVLVTWTTGTEIDNAGFDIYRKEDGSSNMVKVNGSLIPAHGTLGGGASYSFMDTNVVAGTKYLYYLVDIDANGRTTAHGPVSATPYSVLIPSLSIGDGGARVNAAPNMTKLTVK